MPAVMCIVLPLAASTIEFLFRLTIKEFDHKPIHHRNVRLAISRPGGKQGDNIFNSSELMPGTNKVECLSTTSRFRLFNFRSGLLLCKKLDLAEKVGRSANSLALATGASVGRRND